jgi:glycerate 2-kinase
VSGADGSLRIRNLEALLAHGLAAPRRLALEVAEAGLRACDPAAAAERLVWLEGGCLILDGHRHHLDPDGRILVLGSGKASLRIGYALEKLLGERLDGGAIVVRDSDPSMPLERIELIKAAHPLPDERSMEAARRLLEMAQSLGERDTAIACFTGGSSALTSLPPDGVSAADKRELHRLLLGSGMSIADVNTVRKQVSGFKGGRFALAVAPARVINLAVSDVAGDHLDALTDPSVANRTGPAEAIAVLGRSLLWDRIPESVRGHLEAAPSGPLDVSSVEIHSTLLVTGRTACGAMSEAAQSAGARAVVVSTRLEGAASSLGARLGRAAIESADPSGSTVLIGCGGEGTVALGAGDHLGLGGPNQEAALAAAHVLEGSSSAAAFLDTDGSDGGTDLAGAISDGETAERARDAGIAIGAALASHRSGATVRALGDGIDTGPTHTNVNDLFAIAVLPS